MCVVSVYNIYLFVCVHACMYAYVRRGGGEYKITGGHWPFSVHFSKMANQNINQCSPQDFLKV